MDGPEKSDTRPPKTTYASLRIQRLVGLGSEASVVGFVWVGSILGGAGIGYLLDSHFHTSFWTPVLLLVGAVLGFREMLVTVSSLNQKSRKPDAANIKNINRTESAARSARPNNQAAVPITSSPAVQPEKPRIFQVPPPPEPSFGQRAGNATLLSHNREAKDAVSEGVTGGSAQTDQEMPDAVANSEELIKKLLDHEQPSSQ
ncbi:MAG: AtpZ/AtpI family protein [Abitibacteriaceae bacterium]|nr:AtpZ/AtpI family protein [Abditibacteriaceae bacterium]MBV9868294.1 AtpZ/AtpI family protein [Abditibacteriaceae bacterium]